MFESVTIIRTRDASTPKFHPVQSLSVATRLKGEADAAEEGDYRTFLTQVCPHYPGVSKEQTVGKSIEQLGRRGGYGKPRINMRRLTIGIRQERLHNKQGECNGMNTHVRGQVSATLEREGSSSSLVGQPKVLDSPSSGMPCMITGMPCMITCMPCVITCQLRDSDCAALIKVH